ncbi:MAG: helix-hairpin-helix domain-containing protein [Candidatus Eremiobacteraeota bacterium]|uniref:Competence protein ComEA helix-hairpin-helix repeat protein n=1 Tax=mine drainage metagenome TaxID=410659 RepID=E6PCS5_9ZZZZ|nr:helix-hairpin-helix domain-containing protein [Candidatus Eremiobacteraeota bacterium]
MKRWIALPVVAILVAFLALHPAPKPLSVASAAPGEAAPWRAGSGKSSQREGRVLATVLVDVAGRVAHPGLYHLPVGARADAALAAAGGALPAADLDRVDLAALLVDGEELLVPRIGASARRRSTLRVPRTPRGKRGKKGAALVGARVDLNGADASALAAVPGIGPVVAGRILALRLRDGPFDSLDQLLDVAGMSPSRLDQARPYLRV